MLILQRISASFLGIAVLAALSACATTERLDHYADRVTTYNKEAELAQDRAILLNVLRASKRRPLSFFELQSISASGTPSGQVGFSIPLAQNGGTTASTLSPQFNLSSGPTVSANYIDTQEFYQGILKPIPMDTIDYFVKLGMPDGLLFNLFFSKAIVRVHVDKATAHVRSPAELEEYAFSNYASRDADIDRYQKLIAVLLNAGLTTGSADAEPRDIGPLLTAEDVADPVVLIKIKDAKLAVVSRNWCDITAADRQEIIRRKKLQDPRATGSGTGCGPAVPSARSAGNVAGPHAAPWASTAWPSAVYQLRTADGDASHILCFSRTSHQPEGHPRVVSSGSACDKNSGAERTVTVSAETLASLAPLLPDDAPVRRCLGGDKAACPSAAASFDVEFVPRSTYGVIYYLGEISRRKLYPDNQENPERTIMIHPGNPSEAVPPDPCPGYGKDGGLYVAPPLPTGAPKPLSTDAGECRAIFDLTAIPAPRGHFLTVDYDGGAYSVPESRPARGGGADMTNKVLDIVNELLALNRSSKDAPTSSIVILVGAH